MFLAVALLLIILLLGGLGFAAHILWFIAIAAIVIWILGFLVRGAERTWYRW